MKRNKKSRLINFYEWNGFGGCLFNKKLKGRKKGMKVCATEIAEKERNIFLEMIVKKFLIIVEKTYEASIQRNRSYTTNRLMPFETIKKEC